jgi:hypothetical protein
MLHDAENQKAELHELVDSHWNQSFVRQRIDTIFSVESIILETKGAKNDVHYAIDASKAQIGEFDKRQSRKCQDSVRATQDRQRKSVANFEGWKKRCQEFESNLYTCRKDISKKERASAVVVYQPRPGSPDSRSMSIV